MTKQSKIQASETRLPLASLTLSEMNPRQFVDEADVADLAESIWTVGLIQSLAGYQTKKGVEIVAGGRRLRALQHLAAQHPDLETTRPDLASPLVMLAPSRAVALGWATVENTVRQSLTAAEEIRAYGKMAQNGYGVEVIARAFTVSQKHVYKRLALADLPAEILDALEAKQISLSVAEAFTICQDRDLQLEILPQAIENHWSDRSVRLALKPEALRATDRRVIFAGIEEYKAQGGRVSGDLFAEVEYLDDPAVIDALISMKMDAAEKALLAEGWQWVESRTNIFSLHQWTLRHEGFDLIQAPEEGDFSAEDKAISGVILYIDQSGELGAYKGILKVEAWDEAEDAEAAPEAPKSELSNALRDDLKRVAAGARQQACLRTPALMLELLAYQLTHGVPSWQGGIALKAEAAPIMPTTGAEGYKLDARLTERSETTPSLAEYRAKGIEAITADLAERLAALFFPYDAETKAALDEEIKPDMREVWTPTAANFWTRVSPAYRRKIWADLLDLAETDPRLALFEKLKKGEQTEQLEKLFTDADFRAALGLNEEQARRVDTWTPEI